MGKTWAKHGPGAGMINRGYHGNDATMQRWQRCDMVTYLHTKNERGLKI